LLVLLARGRLFPARRSADLGVSSSLTTSAIVKATGVDADRVEAERRETGDLGDAAAWAVANRTQRTLAARDLDVGTVVETLRGLADLQGEGSRARRVDAVAGLLADADPDEARYVVRTALGHLRLGVGEGAVRDAVAAAFLDGSDAAAATVERAYQVTTDFPLVAETARDGGAEALEALEIRPFRPLKLMLAEKAEGLDAAVAGVADGRDDVILESKYDGARVQVHVAGGEVRVFTRRLEDVTAQFPDAVEAVAAALDVDDRRDEGSGGADRDAPGGARAVGEAVLDGELVGYDPDDGVPVRFQEFSRRIRREHDVAELVAEIPVVVHLFDALAVDGDSLLDAPLRDRLARLDAAVDYDAAAGVERARNLPLADADRDDARAFYEASLADGHEGVVAKNLAAAYRPGRRVGAMAKVKPTMEPLDLVVVRAEWSEGRRASLLGRLFLACYDPDADAFREVGRLSTGYTDDELRDLTERLEPLVEATAGRRVDLRPSVVLEVEYEELQASSEYDSGVALRFPRFLGVREDLDPEDADTLSRVRSLYESQ
jgi:DNA ligase-1